MFMERSNLCRSTCHLRPYKLRYARGYQMILPGLYILNPWTSTELVKADEWSTASIDMTPRG